MAPVAPRPESTITFPEQGKTYEIGRLQRFEGMGAFLGSHPDPQYVALRRLSGAGCFWWKGDAMVPWHCSRPIWVRAQVGDGNTWSIFVKNRVQVLDAGRYQLRTQTRGTDVTETSFRIPFNMVEFRLR